MITSVRNLFSAMTPQIPESDFIRARICHSGALCETLDYDDWWGNLGGVEVCLHVPISLSYGWSMIVNFTRLTEVYYLIQTWQGTVYDIEEIQSFLKVSHLTPLQGLYQFVKRFEGSWPRFSD